MSERWHFEAMLDQPAITLPDVDAVAAWAETELAFWDWLRKPGRSNPLNQWWNHTASLSQVPGLVNQYHAATEADRDAVRNQIQATIKKHLTHGVRLTSSDPRAEYVKALADDDAALAAHALVAFVEPQHVPAGQNIGVRALVATEVFHQAISRKGVASRRTALDSIASDWSDLSTQASTQIKSRTKEWKDLVTDHAATLRSHVGKFAEILETSEQHLARIEQTYDEKLALQSPVQYWKRKSHDHRIRAGALGTLFAVLTLGALTVVAVEVVYWILPMSIASGGGAAALWPLTILLATITFLAWPLRLVSRSLQSHLHLLSDADQRAIMVQTYLALQRSGTGLPEGDRRLIIESLFRPTSSGLGTDDGGVPDSTLFGLAALLDSRRSQ